MASRIASRTIFLAEPWLPFSFMNKKLPTLTPMIATCKNESNSNSNCGCRFSVNAKSYSFARSCFNKGHPYSSADDSEQGPPQEAVLRAISGQWSRVGQTTNIVIGGSVADDSTNEWPSLDSKVNSYPTVRVFMAIGTGGDDFVHAMIVAVESVLQRPIPEGRVKQKISSGGKYVSGNIGPVLSCFQ